METRERTSDTSLSSAFPAAWLSALNTGMLFVNLNVKNLPLLTCCVRHLAQAVPFLEVGTDN